MDALDEAQRGGYRPVRQKRVGRPKRYLSDLELKALKQAEQLRRKLDARLKEMPPTWMPDEEFVEVFKQVVAAVNSLSRTYRAGREAEAKAYAGLSEEKLVAVLRVQLPRIATMLTEDEWRALLSTGMGEDIAEAAISIWKTRNDAIAASRAPTQLQPGNTVSRDGKLRRKLLEGDEDGE